MDRKKDCEKAVEALQFRGLVALYEEPSSATDNHVGNGGHTVFYINGHTTQHGLALGFFQQRGNLRPQRSQKGPHTGPFKGAGELYESARTTL
jgi:hypothetical protein